MADDGLRERKKQATRQLISNVATGLFIERGFEEVTVAEIAEAAGVSKMTVVNYFPREEDLFLDRHADRLGEVGGVLRARPPGGVGRGSAGGDHDLAVGARPPPCGATAGGA